MASINNPRSKNLIVLQVKLRTRADTDTIDYLFPLNPASLTINQASRVSATFTYGAKVFQNLGAGLKTLSFEGHTGYRINKDKYGLQNDRSSLALSSLNEAQGPQLPNTTNTAGHPVDGKIHWLDLYAVIQLIKGENKYLTAHNQTGSGGVTDSFSIDNIDNIESVKVTIPDQGITYDVLLQNDSFMRNREQPHLYKYKLDFIIVQESLGSPYRDFSDPATIPDPGTLVSRCSKLANTLTNAKAYFMSLPGIQQISDTINVGISAVNDSINAGNFAITSINSTINDLRRLERITDAINKISANIGLIRGAVNQLKAFSSLSTAFYEPYIAFKHLLVQSNLLKKSLIGEQQRLSFNINLSRLASISAPITLAANKATVAQFQKDMRQINRISFPFPVSSVKEVSNNGATKINIFFNVRPSSLGIVGVKIYAINDFGNENDLVESFSDNSIVLSTNYNSTGYLYNFIVEYNYSTFESIVQSKYKSIKRVLIKKGDTLDSIIKKCAPNEANASKSYISEVAYLNSIEYPYIVTSDDQNFDSYFGSYGYKIFSTQGEFLNYIYNIDTSAYPGQDLVLYDSSIAATSVSFLLQEQKVIDQIVTADKFFVVIFKESYSNRCYAVFGMTNASSCKLFEADSYVICALEKGRTYDIDNNSLFEILSPYTITSDLIDYYGQTSYFEEQRNTAASLFDAEVLTIEQIYIQNIGGFIQIGDYPFTQEDKIFLSGDDENKNYVLLTNFTVLGTGENSSYALSGFSTYHILTDGQEIMLPSFEDKFLPFAEAFTKEDTYKTDLDIRFAYFDLVHASIIPRPDLGEGQGYLDFKLINGVENVKQAIKNRLECPQGGLVLHSNYGLPVLIGKKNTLEHLILLRYNLFNQLMSDARIRSANDIQLQDVGDAINAHASVVLVNNDDIFIKTML